MLLEEALIPEPFITLPSSGVRFPAPVKIGFGYCFNISGPEVTLDEKKILFVLKLLIRLNSGLHSQNAGSRLSSDTDKWGKGLVPGWGQHLIFLDMHFLSYKMRVLV